MMRYARIVGTGRYLPEIEVSNEALKERVGQVDPALVQVDFGPDSPKPRPLDRRIPVTENQPN